ncbi:MAG: phosphoribosylaminoimidazolesuccinocarboxamide synthase [Bacteroidetes bacterium CG12_big_fil_rev_8_21_14_0_65_60_17]|nr:MAG: phosphoribosylaminoimidazolesuccinocarboxamide synthase [Bacteroidetes bacterium CG12_big_fil_rev_8_21_14_0_65_60_17]
MTTRGVIRAQLDHTVQETHFQHLGMRFKGKVRDTYRTGDVLILVTTDRISAFDHVLRQGIPFKGQVLNQLAAWFFEQTSDVCPNHVISVPDPNITVADRCHAVPVEFVVRGYLAGHAWRLYRDGHRTLCGKVLPDGLSQNSRLPEPILTPATKALAGHDEDTTREDVVAQGILSGADFDHLESMALTLFERGSEVANERGLILVDTKYEFGRYHDGTYRVIDEIHTPDSSRYFYSDTYEESLSQNAPQRQLSKEFVREWLMEHGFQGRDGERLPDLSDEFRIDVAARYMELFDRLTGTRFVPDTTHEPIARMQRALAGVGDLDRASRQQ